MTQAITMTMLSLSNLLNARTEDSETYVDISPVLTEYLPESEESQIMMLGAEDEMAYVIDAQVGTGRGDDGEEVKFVLLETEGYPQFAVPLEMEIFASHNGL